MRLVLSSRVARAIPAVAWVAGIFLLSSQSAFPSPPALVNELAAVATHLFLYGVLGILVLVALVDDSRITGRQVRLAVVFCTVYGISDELHHSFVPGRNASGVDVLTDVLGASIACGSLSLLLGRRRYPDDRLSS